MLIRNTRFWSLKWTPNKSPSFCGPFICSHFGGHATARLLSRFHSLFGLHSTEFCIRNSARCIEDGVGSLATPISGQLSDQSMIRSPRIYQPLASSVRDNSRSPHICSHCVHAFLRSSTLFSRREPPALGPRAGSCHSCGYVFFLVGQPFPDLSWSFAIFRDLSRSFRPPAPRPCSVPCLPSVQTFVSAARTLPLVSVTADENVSFGDTHSRRIWEVKTCCHRWFSHFIDFSFFVLFVWFVDHSPGAPATERTRQSSRAPQNSVSIQ
jgi:hypothetical protein